ncbi:hypothetical protein OG898_32955 [Streptomyces sp. NBC_00193]|uniref:DUF6777 domain-containing protein n=1 Tax=unclassified Streptomyces TaxID=2593676 RepID=UPI002257BBFB|nr:MULTISPECIES: DUF6777 domain-containing protein [unclassified Streptomyces]MCX5130181.1 hypothetical protein [Streptomyces sp. NBC_00347]MCX5301219.1 hypothetical protein [Streptomyces sp. NBC_00193]
MYAPTPRQAPRRHAPARAALFTVLGLLAAACGATGDEGRTKGPAAESQDVHLQPVASAGPDPFTSSSATAESAPVQPPLPNATGQGIRTVNAATPGLYGGTQRLGSCDVEAQVQSLTADDAKARAFAEASQVEQEKIPDFLRGLTPVVLRADTRVTNHGFVGGNPNAFQSVLQAGTAVLVDDHGMPRVRCACGNPLAAPRAAKGTPVLKGDPWSGYQPTQVVVIEPTMQVINNLVIVNIADNTWIERTAGDDGAQDRTPRTPPPYDPADGIPAGPAIPPGTSPAEPCRTPESNSLARTEPPTGPPSPGRSPAPNAADCPPGSPQTAPNTPTTPTAPDQPPTGIPSGPPTAPPTAPDQPTDIPSDLPGQTPSDPGTLVGPDGMSPQPSDPYGDPYANPYANPDTDPYADPYSVPEQEPSAPYDGQYLESA